MLAKISHRDTIHLFAGGRSPVVEGCLSPTDGDGSCFWLPIRVVRWITCCADEKNRDLKMLRVSCCDTKWGCTAGRENLGDVIVPAIVERACPPARRDGELERKGRILVDIPSTGRCRFCTDGRAGSRHWSGSCSGG